MRSIDAAESTGAGAAVSATGGAGLSVSLRQRTPIALHTSFDCPPGEVLALVGPSGSGKSTALRCIAGLHHPEQGRVECSGQVWLDTGAAVDLPPQQRRIGMVFQDFALLPHLNVLDNVALALDHLAPAARRARVAELLERVRLGGLGSRRPSELSGGQQQRVALARALARDPAVLLLDEPFSAVDQVTRRKLRLEMAQLTRSLSIPVVLVTHDLDEACMLADRMCVQHDGTSLQQDTPHNVMQHPRDATVARLIDVRNLFEAKVTGHDTGRGTTHIDWNGLALEARSASTYPGGTRVCFCIAPDQVLLHQRVRPSKGVRENPALGRIAEQLTVAGTTSVILQMAHDPALRLEMDLPTHVAARNRLQVGEQVGVSLLARALHVMPWQPLRGA